MQVVEIVGRGGPECLKLREKPDPLPGQGQVLVDVKAAGVNFADVLGRRGLYPDAPKGNFVPGYEISGIVAAVGPGVTAFQPGDRVMGMTVFGGYATKAVTPQEALFKMPDDWDFVRAAATPVCYLTAYMALIRQSRVQADDTVLIHGAAGGVGIAALQICRHVGATIVGTCGSAAKVEFLRSQGVQHPLNYNDEPFDAFVRRELGGVDIVLDAQGGDTTRRGLKILNAGGRLVLYGIANAATNGMRNLLSLAKTVLPMLFINPIGMMTNNTGIFGLNMLNLKNSPRHMQLAQDWLVKAMAEGFIEPTIDATFPLAKAGEAHGRLEHRANIGKVVLIME